MSSPLRVELELDDGSFTARMIHAGETVDQFVQNVGRGVTGVSRMGDEVDSLGERLKTLTFGFWVAREAIHDLESITTGWIGEVVQINAQVERLTTSMKTLSTAADPLAEATAYIKDLREEAKNAPFALETMHQSFLRLKTSGVDAKATLTGLTDAVAAFGGSDENLSRASLAIQEMAGKGVVQMKELRNQLGMSIPNAIPLLARSMGVSYSELMDDIHTGTVDAKAAIASFTAEFERSFGGATLQQMKTFNGEISSMKTRLQDIAITQIGGGDRGFFGGLKNDLADLNAFLDGPAAKGIGQMIGDGLTSGMQVLRTLITEVGEFKNELGAAAEVFMVGLGARMLWSGIEFGISKVQGLRQEITLLALAGRTAAHEMEMNDLGAAVGRLGLTGANGQRLGLTQFQADTRNAGQMLGLFATGVSTVLPWLGLLLPALAAGAEHFGLFHDKAEEAFGTLEKYGAANVEAARKGEAYVANLKEQIAVLERLKKQQQDPAYADIASGNEVDETQLQGLKDKLAKATEQQAKNMQQGSTEESKTYVAKQMAAFSEARGDLQRSYNDVSVKLAHDYDDQQKELKRTFKDGTAAKSEYQRAQLAEQLKQYDAELKKIDELIAAQQALADAAGPGDQRGKNALDTVAALRAEYMKVFQAREAANVSGVVMDPKGIDPQKLFAKGEDSLEKLKAKLQGLVAGVEEGADPAVVELDRLLSGLKLGDPAIEGVQKLREEIVTTKQMADDLNDALKGQKKFEHDLDGVAEGYKEEIFKAKYGKLSEIDQLGIKVQEGLYKGVGPNRSAVEDLLARANQALGDVDGRANKVGDTLAGKAFGSETQAAVKTTADSLKLAADQVERMSQGLASLDFTAVFDKAKTSLQGFGMFSGAGGSFVETLIGRESGGKADAKNPLSSAQGIGQFIDGTWKAFLASRHPELLGGDMTAQRKDPDLGREAIQWYAQQNAHDLSKAGYDPTDANLYMSHLLGSGGAKQVLGADPSAKISDISDKLAQAVAVNPFLRGKTAGDLQAQLNAQFGTGYTALGGGPGGGRARITGNVGPEYTPGSVPAGLPNEADTQKFADVQQLKEQRDQAVADAKLHDKISELGDKLATLNVRVDDSKGKNFAEVMTAIQTGKLGPSKDPKDPENAKALETAQKLDDAIKQLDNQKKDRTSADDAIKQLAKDKGALQVSSQDIYSRAGDPNAIGRSAELVRKQQQNAQNLTNIGNSYGTDSQQYQDAQKQAAANEDEYRNQEIAKNIEALRSKTATLRESLMDGDGSRQDAFNREKKRIDDELAAFKGSEEQKKQLAKDASDYITAANQKLAMSGPMSQQMKGWGDMMGNMEKGVTSWSSSLTDSLSTMITTGKTNWASLSQTITKDMVNMGLKYGMSSIFGGVTGKGTGGASKIAGGTSKLGGMKAFATGGQISGPGTGTSDSMMARVSNGEFVVNAKAAQANLGLLHALNSGRMPAFATGGEIDTSALPSAASGQNFQPEMIDNAMSARSAGTTHQWNITTQLHAQGGSTVQNQDLARRASAEMEASVRRVAMDEILRQRRPGGALRS